MALLDLLGRRWAPRILWELRGVPLRFRELQTRCGGVSPTVLNRRIQEFRDAGIVDLSDEGYVLTEDGRDLMAALTPLARWAERWSGGKVGPVHKLGGVSKVEEN